MIMSYKLLFLGFQLAILPHLETRSTDDRPRLAVGTTVFSLTGRHLRPRHDCAFLISRSLPPPLPQRTTELHIYTHTHTHLRLSVSLTQAYRNELRALLFAFVTLCHRFPFLLFVSSPPRRL